MNVLVTVTDTETTIRTQIVNGTAAIYSERGNGTTRRRHYLADGTTERAEAEWIRVQRLGQEASIEGGVEYPAVAPRTMKSIAAELNLSVSAVRRILNDLAITQEIEESDDEELQEMVLGSTEAN